jgi:MFS superfamily sulfate permease-like transporter
MILEPDAAGQWVPAPATPGQVTAPGLIIYRFGSDLFYANANRFVDELRALVRQAPQPLSWLIVDCGAITDIDYSAAQAVRDLLTELAPQKITVLFGRVSSYLRSDLNRHGITPVVGEARIFATLHEAVAAAHDGRPVPAIKI